MTSAPEHEGRCLGNGGARAHPPLTVAAGAQLSVAAPLLLFYCQRVMLDRKFQQLGSLAQLPD